MLGPHRTAEGGKQTSLSCQQRRSAAQDLMKLLAFNCGRRWGARRPRQEHIRFQSCIPPPQECSTLRHVDHCVGSPTKPRSLGGLPVDAEWGRTGMHERKCPSPAPHLLHQLGWSVRAPDTHQSTRTCVWDPPSSSKQTYRRALLVQLPADAAGP